MAKLWGSRFKKANADPLADAFTFSIGYDSKLAKYDVIGSMAHARMLGTCGIIPKADAQALVTGLKRLLKEIERGAFSPDPQAEDIHTDIQQRLKRDIGTAADKLHTARSRNDLVVLDMKLYCLDQLSETGIALEQLQNSILGQAEKYQHVIIPAYTHLQAAQVVSASHHLLAYVEMLDRDKSRLLDALKRTDVMPLGSCALSGTSLPIDRRQVAKELQFSDISRNSIDAVSDRDFIVEALAILSIIAMHFSRMAEDLILWTTQEFGFIEIDEAYCTGSSIMPHKKNPDVLELIRGETGRVYGRLHEILVMLKGLPLTYNRDLQLDKPALFSAFEQILLMTRLLTKIFKSMTFSENALSNRIHDESFFTVDMMEYLIRKGVSYRDAHDSIGRIVSGCMDRGQRIRDLSAEDLKTFCPQIEEDVKDLLDPTVSVNGKQSSGSTKPAMVAREIRNWKKSLHPTRKKT